MAFENEKDFEDALVAFLPTVGWDEQVLVNYDEARLLQNWAEILFTNNRSIDRLNEYPLTQGEMRQIMEQVRDKRTPFGLNSFINGRFITIIRDNEADKAHFGKPVSLKIYDRQEIAAGQSRYQIARQPRFTINDGELNRRGDLMLLINGMPLIHIELKRSGVPVLQACNQVERYSKEGVYNGIFSLVQIFVAMNPEDAVYFANPGSSGEFNDKFFFHWGDRENEPILTWDKFARELLSIPMAHKLIGFYSVADRADDTLKVMRSYQYHAASKISDIVRNASIEGWMAAKNGANQRGGHIWHTTGSGKTLTSFKSAQLIADSKDADKVVFLVDRRELATQSFKEYANFADTPQDVNGTENTGRLLVKLKSDDPGDTLIITSIQKMSRIRQEGYFGLKAADLDKIRAKRLVFIVDECHRSTFGKMLGVIKEVFPTAIFFGFTGTPIQAENQKKDSTTATVFGDELHRYTIAHGIRDGNVLGFDPYQVLTFNDDQLRMQVALKRAKAENLEDALADDRKKRIYEKFLALPMAGKKNGDGKYVRGIEDYVPNVQYRTKDHQDAVVTDILNSWSMLSRGGKFHALLATSSISEAIEYYHLLKNNEKGLKVAALFDPNIDDRHAADKNLNKENALTEIIKDYNRLFDLNFNLHSLTAMKCDIGYRLAHKEQYKNLSRSAQLDLLIVVDQMLTGFDSKWLNTLYLDKTLRFESLIQAISRTNRIFGDEKPHGTIRYYRRPHSMKRNLDEALELYSGNRPYGVFVQKLPANLKKINALFDEICAVFKNAGLEDFSKLPQDKPSIRQFVKQFNEFNGHLEAATVQGFSWKKKTYEFENEPAIEVIPDEADFLALSQRYRELYTGADDGEPDEEAPYDLRSCLTAIQNEAIDADYIDSRFFKFAEMLAREDANEEWKNAARDELHRSFASLSQHKQKIAEMILHDMQRGEFAFVRGKSFHDYLAEYMSREENTYIEDLVQALGLDRGLLKELMDVHPTEATINHYSRLDKLKDTVDWEKARAYFALKHQKAVSQMQAKMWTDKLLRKFILTGGFDPATYS